MGLDIAVARKPRKSLKADSDSDEFMIDEADDLAFGRIRISEYG